jgi:hypothetical protein
VYEKLNKARKMLHTKGMKMTGKNKFADYEYFELADFIPAVITICDEVGIIPLVSFAEDIATMEVVDVTDSTKITFTSPMSTALLKGCHPVQNLGAVETYVRRYLYQTAFEIVEHDALNATQGADKPKQLGKPVGKYPVAFDTDAPAEEQPVKQPAWLPPQRFTPGDAYKHLKSLATEEEVKETLKNLGASRSSEITYDIYKSAVCFLCDFPDTEKDAA